MNQWPFSSPSGPAGAGNIHASWVQNKRIVRFMANLYKQKKPTHADFSDFHIPSKPHTETFIRFTLPRLLWSSPRPISIGQLHTLLCFHLQPIYLVVFKGS